MTSRDVGSCTERQRQSERQKEQLDTCFEQVFCRYFLKTGGFFQSSAGCYSNGCDAGFSQQALDGQQNDPDVIESGPLVFQDVQADVSMGVHTEVVTGCEDFDYGCIVRIAFPWVTNSRESLSLRSSQTVPAVPWMVLTDLQRLSYSRKAEIPLPPDIMRVLSCCCSLYSMGYLEEPHWVQVLQQAEVALVSENTKNGIVTVYNGDFKSMLIFQ